MSSRAQVSEAMQMILTSRAKALERQTGFVQRSTVELDGPVFAQTCFLTWMHTPDAGYWQLRHTAACLGVHVSNQAIEQRFSKASSRLLRALLEEAVVQVISSEASDPELLGRFNGIYLQDGTVISLPPTLAEQWQGSGKAGQEAAMRVQGRVKWSKGQLHGLWLRRELGRPNAVVQRSRPHCRLAACSWRIWAILRCKRCVRVASWSSIGSPMPKLPSPSLMSAANTGICSPF